MINYKIPKNLLSKGISNAKTKKNNSHTYILYLAPYKQNSLKINICPKASKGCAAACLFSAGRGKFSNVVKARINKTEYFLRDKNAFINQLAKELIKINNKAILSGSKTLIRLNGTSDLDFIYMLKKYANFDIHNFIGLHFYDYTKILGKVKKYINNKNYTLTFSRADTKFWLGAHANNGTPRIHPTEKPIALYEWLLMNYAKEGDKILDTHLGSGSIAIACHNLGYDLTGYELDKEYYNNAIKRIKKPPSTN